MPRPWIDRAPEALRGPSGLALLAIAAVWLVAVAAAPLDASQGSIQKILYVHAPLAYAAFLGFAMTALCGALYLHNGEEGWDRAAHSAAEVGVLFCTLVLITGPIWGKGTWGRWWTWDLRLSLTLVMWFIYLAYLLLRNLVDGNERAARYAAVYGIVGTLLIPLNYFAIDLAGSRTLHPENLRSGSLGPGLGWPFLLGSIAIVAAFVHLLLRRIEVQQLRDALARHMAAVPSDIAGHEVEGGG